MKISEINLDESNPLKTGLKDRHLDKKEKFKHINGIQYKLLPFNTKWYANYSDEFSYFDGILGEAIRCSIKKDLSKDLINEHDYNTTLKNRIIDAAVKKTEIDEGQESHFRNLLSELFFDGNRLFRFDESTLPYLSFKHGKKKVKEIADFIYDLFLKGNYHYNTNEIEDKKENLLHQLMSESLPKLIERRHTPNEYLVWENSIISYFKLDFNLLRKNQKDFLKYISPLLKYYYFIYVAQVAMKLGDFFTEGKHDIFFLLENEQTSRSREGFRSGWNMLEDRIKQLFSHVCTLEMLNYIKINGTTLGSYREMSKKYNSLNEESQEKLLDKVSILIKFYQEKIKPITGWDECFSQLKMKPNYKNAKSPFDKLVYKFWYMVDFQFQNSGRKARYDDYSSWFIEYAKANFIKRRGRVGYTLKLEQEMLLFMTKLCVGEEDKIRLKTLWDRLADRGIHLDETSKIGVVEIFEKINLLEKKSDSGDAQFVRSIL